MVNTWIWTDIFKIQSTNNLDFSTQFFVNKHLFFVFSFLSIHIIIIIIIIIIITKYSPNTDGLGSSLVTLSFSGVKSRDSNRKKSSEKI